MYKPLIAFGQFIAMTGIFGFLCQVAPVPRLQVDASLDRELELLAGPLEHLDRLALIYMDKFRADDPVELRDQPPFSICSPGSELFWSDGAALA
jgi:hypothetical protein